MLLILESPDVAVQQKLSSSGHTGGPSNIEPSARYRFVSDNSRNMVSSPVFHTSNNDQGGLCEIKTNWKTKIEVPNEWKI